MFVAGLVGLAATQGLCEPLGQIGVVELRQYTLKGSRRAAFTDLFEREFITTQAAVGSHVLAIFRDLDDPDRFVWMRGFADMAARKAALEAFYFGPVWKAHREAANAMIVDSDNVMLLRPLPPSSGLINPKKEARPGIVRIAVQRLRDIDPAAFGTFYNTTMRPMVERAGGQPFAELVTESSENTFPRLPVREHDPVFIWMARFPNEAAERSFDRRLAQASGWRDDAPPSILPALMQKAEVLRLQPSRLSPIQ